MGSPQHLARLVERAEAGDTAARDALFSALYEELHRLAQALLHRNGGNLTLGATTLLHEAYLSMAARNSAAFPDRNRFLGYAARAMRGLIIDYVRTRGAVKRGGDVILTPLGEQGTTAREGAADLEQIASALDDLSKLDPALAELVDLKFFCGFTFGEVAAMRGVSERTVQRDWAKARLLLHRSLTED
jgi:RNA polymerase sigma factor (TIGR02999 family)